MCRISLKSVKSARFGSFATDAAAAGHAGGEDLVKIDLWGSLSTSVDKLPQRSIFFIFSKNTVDDPIRFRNNLMTQRKKRKRNCGGSRPQEVRNEKIEL